MNQMKPATKFNPPPFALLLLASCVLAAQLASAGLASFVINRPRLFQRTQPQVQPNPQPNQQQQQQLLTQASQPHMMFAANQMMPNYGHFGLSGRQADELLRLDAAQAARVQSHQGPLALEPDFSHLAPVGLEAQAAHYYKPSVRPAVAFVPAQSAAAAGAEARGLRVEPSQTEQIVDKIERHIGRQIEQSLTSEHSAAASGYHRQQRDEEAKEKEASASQPEESGEMEEPAAEKREEKKAADEEDKHEHHPMEAFEVHHKKGGKSYQYFHQGHSS